MLHIYKASAGSGKTYRLAKDYITMLLGIKGPDGKYRLNRGGTNAHRAILAITFTNKATEEMKRRILHELAVLGGCEHEWSESSPYEEDLVKELNCTPQELRAAAKRALTMLVMDYSYFNVSTIDSFFQNVLRTFAREAQVMGDYNLTLDNTEVLSTGVGDMLTSLSNDQNPTVNSQLTDWITEYMKENLLQGKATNIFNRVAQLRSNVVSFINNLSNEEFEKRYDELMTYLRDTKKIADFRKELVEKEKETDGKLRQVGQAMLDIIAATNGIKANVAGMAQKLRDGNYEKGVFDAVGFRAVRDEVEEKVFNKGRADSSVLAQLTPLAVEAEQLKGLKDTYRAIAASLHIVGLTGRVYECIEERQRHDNTLKLSSTGALLHSIIGEDDAPFIYERLGQRLRHYLIDEFQDTSLLQWENLRPLLRESQAYEEDNDNLIIGDEKQCIYRFRNSDPSLLREQVEKQFSRIALEGATAEGNTNWRSSDTVVRFNNTLFTLMPMSERNSDIYTNVVQQVCKKHTNRQGYVKICRLEEGTKDELLAESAKKLRAEVKRLLETGYKPCDIAVLTRKVKEAQYYINDLLEYAASGEAPRPFTVISDDSLRVDSAPAVRAIISRMRYICAGDQASHPNAMSRRQFASLFNGFEQGMAAARAASTGGDVDGDPYAAGRVLSDVVATLKRNEDGTPDVAPLSTTDNTVLATDLSIIAERIIAELPEEECKEQAVYITAFMDMLGEYTENGSNDLNSFLRWWDQNSERAKISSPESADAIRVMTIHKSKGLEFPCVIIPQCNWALADIKGAKWFVPKGLGQMKDPSVVPPLVAMQVHSKLKKGPYREDIIAMVDDATLDELNALYVALTRAKDELVAFISVKEKKESSKKSDEEPTMTVADIMVSALNQMTSHTPTPLTLGVRFDAETNTYEAGAPTIEPWKEKKDEPKALDPVESVAMPPYRVMDRQDLWRDTSVDLAGTDQQPDEDEETREQKEQKRTRGLMLHNVLSEVRHRGDVKRAVLKAVHTGAVPEGEAAEVEALLERELEREEVKCWFENTQMVMSERTIYIGPDSETGKPKTRRPDRVVLTEAGTLDIIDYKTGDWPEEPEEQELRIKSYRRQVRRYARLLREALPMLADYPVRTFIWHLDTSAIIPIDK